MFLNNISNYLITKVATIDNFLYLINFKKDSINQNNNK